ncbi:g1219 [Coccomyxa elongata]
MGTESGVREERLSTVCGGGAVVVLIEYEGGKEECSYEWAKEQMTLMEANTLQRRILRCEGDLEFAVRSRRLSMRADSETVDRILEKLSELTKGDNRFTWDRDQEAVSGTPPSGSWDDDTLPPAPVGVCVGVVQREAGHVQGHYGASREVCHGGEPTSDTQGITLGAAALSVAAAALSDRQRRSVCLDTSRADAMAVMGSPFFLGGDEGGGEAPDEEAEADAPENGGDVLLGTHSEQ